MDIDIKETSEVPLEDIIELCKANSWSSADKPDRLYKALLSSHSSNCMGRRQADRTWKCHL